MNEIELKRMKKIHNTFHHWRKLFFQTQPYWNMFFVVAVSVIFSTGLMFSTFSYRDDTIVMGSKIWSDFWANIPLIRSFSHGDNIPPEYPLFPGERIRYHFLFFFLVGMLERAGTRIDLALNFFSIIGFSGMLIGIYALTKHLSKSQLAGWLSIVLLIFNSSFSWMYYLDKGVDTLPEIVTNKDYGSHGPYDNTVVSGFWKLNVYTNQRHFAFALAVLAISIWSISYTKNKFWPFLGILLLISLSWMHKVVLLIAFLILGAQLLTQQGKRKRILGALLLCGALSIPGILYLNGDGITTEKAISFRPGFLYNSTDWHEFSFQLTQVQQWLVYWLLNLGVLPIIGTIGWIVVVLRALPKKKLWKQILYFFTSEASVWFGVGVAVFVIANLFGFASDLGTNHKFINFTQIILSAFSASLLAYVWKTRLSVITPVLLVLLTLGGVFDFFPVFNDSKVFWEDVQKDKVAQWIVENTPPDTVFLNTSYMYNSIVISGRKVFWGWDYFTSSIGYPLAQRRQALRPVLSGEQPIIETCKFLHNNNIRYIHIAKNANVERFADTMVSNKYFKETFGEHVIEFDQAVIYDSQPTCQNRKS